MSKKAAKPETTTASDMDGQELWTKLQKLGFTQVGFAKTVKIHDTTVRKWIANKFPVPMVVALLVNLMIKTKTKAEDLP